MRILFAYLAWILIAYLIWFLPIVIVDLSGSTLRLGAIPAVILALFALFIGKLAADRIRLQGQRQAGGNAPIAEREKDCEEAVSVDSKTIALESVNDKVEAQREKSKFWTPSSGELFQYVILVTIGLVIGYFLAIQTQYKRGPSSFRDVGATDRAQPIAPQANSELAVVSTTQDAEDLTPSMLNLDVLGELEAETVNSHRRNMRQSLSRIGQDWRQFEIVPSSVYVDSGGNRFAVIRMNVRQKGTGADFLTRSVTVFGIVGDELRRVSCVRKSAEYIPVSYGKCKDEIERVFGTGIDP